MQSPAFFSQRSYSVGRRFSYAFIGVVTLILFSFATIGILHNISKASAELEKCIDNIWTNRVERTSDCASKGT